MRTSPPPLYVNQTHEDWSLPAYSVFRAGRDPERHLFFRRGGNRKSQCRATGRPVGQRQSGAAFVDCVNIFTCNLRCKVPCSILHATLSFWNAHNKQKISSNLKFPGAVVHKWRRGVIRHFIYEAGHLRELRSVARFLFGVLF